MQDWSQDFELNRIKVSMAASKGSIRKQMEDDVDIVQFLIGTRAFYAFAVFDGHCATLKKPEKSTVGFVKTNFMNYLQRQLAGNNIRTAIQETFLLLNHDLKHEDSGSTVSLLLIADDPREVWVANIGDSSVCGFCKHPEKIQKLSVDHKPHLKSEMKRMKLKSESNRMKFKVDDGYVVNGIGDSLAMTRSLGDCSFQDFITSKPSITKVNQSFDLILLASDGLWDCMSGKDVWQIIKKQQTHSAKQLLDYRNKMFEQHDNVAIILVCV